MPTLDTERDKYRRMWAHKDYRISSPGDRAVPTFINSVSWRKGETLIDLGCGTGRASKKLAEYGFLVTMLDFCEDAVEVKDLPFIEANLWDLPSSLPAFDWVYCSDVLEHLPPEHVDAALDGIARLTKKGGFLQIACFQDGCGSLIGEELHLTVHPPTWWDGKVRQRWVVNQELSDPQYAVYMIGEAYAQRDGSLQR